MKDQFVKKFIKAQARRYLGLAGYVIYIYDLLITYSEVQDLIWPSPMGVVKVCYYFNRILVPIGLTINTWQMSGLTEPLSDTFCKGWLTAAGYMGIISLSASNMILILWVHAIYGRSKRVMFGLLALFVASYAAILVIMTLRSIDLQDQIIYAEKFKACGVNQTRSNLPSIQAVPIDIVLEVLIFCMTLCKSFGHARTVKSFANSPFLWTLYRDGLGYFILIIIIKLANVVVWYLGKKTIYLFGTDFIWGVTTALISRLLLNLRRVNDHSKHADLDSHEAADSLTFGAI